MDILTLQQLVGSYVYIGFTESLVIAGYEPPGPTRLIFVKLTGVDEHGIFFEHDKFPLTNKRTGEVELSKTQVFVPFTKISHLSAFPDIPDFSAYEPTTEPVTFLT
ncbi:MAG TPA: hypothetical protein PK176_03480 [Acidobacteriota bacterium]|nr:hypothetical protein [Acidobacteriota bacterium]HQM62351.1 hypothetical protein [Acidobacteriota bacterium]